MTLMSATKVGWSGQKFTKKGGKILGRLHLPNRTYRQDVVTTPTRHRVGDVY